MTICESIKRLVVDGLLANTSFQQIQNGCVVTLPLATLDGRWVDVFIEPWGTDYFLITDGGKATNELILQGMKITPSVEKDFENIANRFRISYADEMFKTGSKMDAITQAISAVGMSSMLAMTELLNYAPMAAEEPLSSQVGQLLRAWGRYRAKLRTDVRNIPGRLKQHSFDFVLEPRKSGKVISISILNPTAGSLSAAERFGFKVQDLKDTLKDTWRYGVIEAKSEVWSEDARRIVESCAAFVIPVRSGENPPAELIKAALERQQAA